LPFPYIHARNDSFIQGYGNEVFIGKSEVSRALQENFGGRFRQLVDWASHFNREKFLKHIKRLEH